MCTDYEFNSVRIVLYSVSSCKHKSNESKGADCVCCCKDDTGVLAVELAKAGHKHWRISQISLLLHIKIEHSQKSSFAVSILQKQRQVWQNFPIQFSPRNIIFVRTHSACESSQKYQGIRFYSDYNKHNAYIEVVAPNLCQ